MVTTESHLLLEGVTDVLRHYWDRFYSRRREEMSLSRLAKPWMRSITNKSSSTPVVALEPSDEQVLFNLLRIFGSNPIIDNMRDTDLILPSTLFLGFIDPSGLSIQTTL